MRIHTNYYKEPLELETEETDLILRCIRCGALFMPVTLFKTIAAMQDVHQDDEGNFLCKNCHDIRDNPDCED